MGMRDARWRWEMGVERGRFEFPHRHLQVWRIVECDGMCVSHLKDFYKRDTRQALPI